MAKNAKSAKNMAELKELVQEEIGRYKGIAVPVRMPLLHRLTVDKLPLQKLHPNPDDEFCFPEIGPKDSIISDYAKDFARFGNDVMAARLAGSRVFERVQVQKIRPDGYMILNGHNRWAAAMRAGRKNIGVEIVNVTREKDIRRALKFVRNDRRVALDLDEIVFAAEGEPAEKGLGFPWNKLYPQTVRLGIPSLFHFLKSHRYDIWVYSDQLISDDNIRRLFLHYHAGLPFVVTGTGKKGAHGKNGLTDMEKMISNKYKTTFHIDLKSVVMISGGSFETFDLPGKAIWSAEVEDVFRKLGQNG